MIEGTLGTRIKLSPLQHPGRAAIEAGGDQGSDEAGSDPESIEGLGVDVTDDTPLLFLKPSGDDATETSPTTMPMEVGSAEPVVLSAEVGDEPPTKRLKINQLETAHVDEVDVVQSCDLDVSLFEYETGGDDNDFYFGFLSLRKSLRWSAAYWRRWMHLQISSRWECLFNRLEMKIQATLAVL